MKKIQCRMSLENIAKQTNDAYDTIIKISLITTNLGNTPTWERVNSSKVKEKNAIFIEGEQAKRIYELLTEYKEKPKNPRRKENPDCHGSVAYIMGFVDYTERMSPKKIMDLYDNHAVKTSYLPKESPSIIHLLKEASSLKKDKFIDATVHSAILLGSINDEKICFEKRGYGKALISTLKAAKKIYEAPITVYAHPNK